MLASLLQDAAFGAFAAALPELAHYVKDLALADSIVVSQRHPCHLLGELTFLSDQPPQADGHKWCASPPVRAR